MGLLFASGCGRLERIVYDPPTTPEQWCRMRPCVDLGGRILNEPLATFLVYLLALLSVWAGLHYGRTAGASRSRRWWGYSLVLGGIGAGLAGTSYQAFSYELKCAGRELCVWTSWWEVAYLIFQNLSIDAMVVAVAYSSTTGRFRRGLLVYAGVHALLHLLLTAIGTVSATAWMVSFEILLAFSLPALLLGVGLNTYRYARFRTRLDLALLGCWAWLVATSTIYFAYLQAGFTERFWQEGAGFYFSANDVLHVGMIGWTLYIRFALAPLVADDGDGDS